jgi:mannose-6-phosphate isomerase-like protein (cupin superfamily)
MTDTQPNPQPVFLDAAQFAQGQVFQLKDALARDDVWFNQALVNANESVLRVARLHGEFHHHSHDTDELFFVIDGAMQIELDGMMHDLPTGSGVCVPAGMVHRTRADQPCTVLLVAAADASMAGVTPAEVGGN